MSQHEMVLIARKIENHQFDQRDGDGYFNATAMCRATGKRFHDYSRLGTTTAFLNALELETGIPVSKLVQQFRGRPAHLQGTWVHPHVAVQLAQWLSPEFAVQVSKWVVEWFSGKASQAARLPDHIRRYLANLNKIPPGYFSMLNEMTTKLLGPLEEQGYILPGHMMPDIALGRMFSGWLQRTGRNPDSFLTYEHEFLDHRPTVRARLYPNEVLTEFEQHLRRWITDGRARRYFGDRDEQAIVPLDRVIAALPAPPKQLGPGDADQ